jgi:Domain of unknown function (DUF4385)
MVEAYRKVDFRRHPEQYRVARGKQGVLTAEPYKSESLPLWRFKTEREARYCARALHGAFVAYRDVGDFGGHGYGTQILADGPHQTKREPALRQFSSAPGTKSSGTASIERRAVATTASRT